MRFECSTSVISLSVSLLMQITYYEGSFYGLAGNLLLVTSLAVSFAGC